MNAEQIIEAAVREMLRLDGIDPERLITGGWDNGEAEVWLLDIVNGKKLSCTILDDGKITPCLRY